MDVNSLSPSIGRSAVIQIQILKACDVPDLVLKTQNERADNKKEETSMGLRTLRLEQKVGTREADTQSKTDRKRSKRRKKSLTKNAMRGWHRGMARRGGGTKGRDKLRSSSER